MNKKVIFKMNKDIVIAVIIMLLAFGFGSIFYNCFIVDEVIFRPLEGEVTYGENLVLEIYSNTTEIKLGTMRPGISGIVSADEKNDNPFPIKVELKPFGEIKDLIIIEPTSFILEPGEEKIYKITFQPNLQSKEKIYNGTLKVTKKRLLW